jgi:DNA-binding transcriptional regulator YiaG
MEGSILNLIESSTDSSQQASFVKFLKYVFLLFRAEHMTKRIVMTTNQITLLPFGLGLTTTTTSDAYKHNATGTKAVEIYKLTGKQAELSVDDMFAQLEQSDSRVSGAMEVGTKWVAETFLSDESPTLATLRMKAGLSQRELAKRLKVSQPQIAKWESPDTKNWESGTIVTLAKALSIDAKELFGVLIDSSKGK